uniref:Uncharacterized protein n=1 Tax=Knipowitschia caucasica TaxID=637954 RepID=A0AAV2J530_KNICA
MAPITVPGQSWSPGDNGTGTELEPRRQWDRDRAGAPETMGQGQSWSPGDNGTGTELEPRRQWDRDRAGAPETMGQGQSWSPGDNGTGTELEPRRPYTPQDYVSKTIHTTGLYGSSHLIFLFQHASGFRKDWFETESLDYS